MLRQWDQTLTLLLNGSDSLYMDGVMWTITHTITWVPMMCVLLYILVKNNDMKRLWMVLIMLALLILVSDQFASSFCKPYFHRLRPSHNPYIEDMVDVVNGYRGGLYGFISSHASNTFGAALFLTLILRSWKTSACLYVWALMCSYSRIYLGVHYLGDVVAGACAGSVFAIIAYLTYYYLQKKYCVNRSFYSSAYTSTGYLTLDLEWFYFTFVLTLLYVSIRAVFYASVF